MRNSGFPIQFLSNLLVYLCYVSTFRVIGPVKLETGLSEKPVRENARV